MIEINWNPLLQLGPFAINWYGLGWATALLTGWSLIARWAPRFDVPRAKVDSLILWIMVGTMIGARAYFILQNDPGAYLAQP